MNFYTQIGLTHKEFTERYENTGLVERRHHHEFPLDILHYSRKCVRENIWDAVTGKCRGIIITRGADGGEIVSRPFEKFHNYGAEPGWGATTFIPSIEPVIWEKMDGFMCTLYTWEGVDYIASKGSFDSIHAKWATAWLRRYFGKSLEVPAGYTAVFEGLHCDLRIVVGYGLRQELVLLALINKETGEEFTPGALFTWADSRGLSMPRLGRQTLDCAVKRTLTNEFEDGLEEGYVLTWYQNGKPPFRLKLKFIEYLRLHRMVTGVSPKRIWEVLATNQSTELNEYLEQSTPWFSAFVQKWMKALNAEYRRIEGEANKRFDYTVTGLRTEFQDMLGSGQPNFTALRKAYALSFTAEENKPYSGVLFAMLDGKDVKPVIWKLVRRMTHGGNPMVDAHNT
jgi:RNA ligase